MLTITETAGKHMAEMLSESGAPDEVALRFVVDDDALGMALDKPKPEDTTFDHDGRTVLVLDGQIAELLEERTLDLEQTDEGPRLALT